MSVFVRSPAVVSLISLILALAMAGTLLSVGWAAQSGSAASVLVKDNSVVKSGSAAGNENQSQSPRASVTTVGEGPADGKPKAEAEPSVPGKVDRSSQAIAPSPASAAAVLTKSGGTPSTDAANPHAAMEASIAAQKAAIQKQRSAVAGSLSGRSSSSFFTTPWTSAITPVDTSAAGISLESPPDADQTARASPADWKCPAITEPELTPLIQDAAGREGVKPALVRAIIQKESAAHPCALSNKGAQGLMQLMPATAARFNVKDPFDPKQNIDAGVRFLKELLVRYNQDVSLALGAYNAGPARVDQTGAIPAIPETQDYVTDILSSVNTTE